MIAGIWPLTSFRNAEFMVNELRVPVPAPYMERMRPRITPRPPQAEGVAIAREMVEQVRGMVAGVQLSAPFGRYRLAVEVAEAIGSRVGLMNGRTRELDDALATRILVMDGAMGTMLQEHNPTAADFGGEALENCNENLCRTRPDWILDVHRAYLEAGSDLIATNSFQGSPIVLAEFQLADKTHELNVLAAQLARQAADEFSTTAKPRFVAGALGPTTKSITLRGDVTFQQLQRQLLFAGTRPDRWGRGRAAARDGV